MMADQGDLLQYIVTNLKDLSVMEGFNNFIRISAIILK